jgi:hypothetical protein
VPDDHRLRKLSAELPRSGLGALLSLSPLNLSQVAELTHAVLTATTDLAERLFHETDGLPYFVVEYLEALRTHGGEDWSMPPSISIEPVSMPAHCMRMPKRWRIIKPR